MATQNIESKLDEMSGDTVPVKEQSNYTMDSLGKLMVIMIIMGLLCATLIFIYILLSPARSPSAVYFKSTANGQLIQDVPLDQPNLPNNILLNWVTESMMDVHTFNFVNYNTAIENARNYFTKEGFDSYVAALRDTKILEEVINKKYVLRAVPTSAPQITKEGVLANFYLWKIKLPLFLRYRNVTTDRYDDAELTLLVMRVPSTDAPFGIRILKYELAIQSRAPGL